MGMKLFALEETNLEGDVAEMEATPEVGEVADVEAEVQEETVELSSQEEAIEEGIEAADQLEEVQEVVADAAEGEGLTPHAAECLRIAVEAICARVGANPKAMYSLYATENFQSASSRKANTRIALEGVVEFLKDLWRKIKASLIKLWEKAKAFFEKHFSSLGRIKKALESMREKISESSGKVKDKVYFDEAPSSLVDAFAGDKDISSTVVRKYINAHNDADIASAKMSEKIDSVNAQIKTIKANSEDIERILNTIKSAFIKGSGKNTFSLGAEANPLIGGVYITYTFDYNENEGELTVDVDREVISNKESKLGISIGDKASLQESIKLVLEVINKAIKAKEKHKKRQDAFNKTMLAIDQVISKIGEGDSGKSATESNSNLILPSESAKNNSDGAKDNSNKPKDLRKLMKVVYKINSKTALMDTTLFALNVKLAKAVLNYCSFSLKQYKSVD